ncbi:MAG: hypothetical protein HRT88_17310 [Lentisphaeraceae bacterium]|nr:hypothetical protein [Lentisphaeraceae bacterium]
MNYRPLLHSSLCSFLFLCSCNDKNEASEDEMVTIEIVKKTSTDDSVAPMKIISPKETVVEGEESDSSEAQVANADGGFDLLKLYPGNIGKLQGFWDLEDYETSIASLADEAKASVKERLEGFAFTVQGRFLIKYKLSNGLIDKQYDLESQGDKILAGQNIELLYSESSDELLMKMGTVSVALNRPSDFDMNKFMGQMQGDWHDDPVKTNDFVGSLGEEVFSDRQLNLVKEFNAALKNEKLESKLKLNLLSITDYNFELAGKRGKFYVRRINDNYSITTKTADGMRIVMRDDCLLISQEGKIDNVFVHFQTSVDSEVLGKWGALMNDDIKEYYQNLIESGTLNEEKTEIIKSLIENDDVFLFKYKDQLALEIAEKEIKFGTSYIYRAIKLGALNAFFLYEDEKNIGLIIAQKDELGWRFLFPDKTDSILHNLYWQKK